jgi:hypothetical protein
MHDSAAGQVCHMCIKDLQLDRAVAIDVIKDVTKQR